MATVHTPPIDLYAESIEDIGTQQERDERHRAWPVRPADNGDRDEPAIDAGEDRLDRVLGW